MQVCVCVLSIVLWSKDIPLVFYNHYYILKSLINFIIIID